jgi:prophage regulatory protein
MQVSQIEMDRPSRILRIKVVLQRTGLSRATLYRKVADGSFPKQIQISTRCIGWRESAVEAWLRTPTGYRPGNEM